MRKKRIVTIQDVAKTTGVSVSTVSRVLNGKVDVTRETQVRASGGGTRGALWRQILASVLEAELVTVNTSEGAAYGAALLAGVAPGPGRTSRRRAGPVLKSQAAPCRSPLRWTPIAGLTRCIRNFTRH